MALRRYTGGVEGEFRRKVKKGTLTGRVSLKGKATLTGRVPVKGEVTRPDEFAQKLFMLSVTTARKTCQ